MDTTQPTMEFGKYEIIQSLGSGGYADVFLALDKNLNRRVALKILKRRWMEPTFVENFEREAKAIAALEHPNIITIHEQARHEDRVYISMTYVPDGNLEERIRQEGPFSPDQVAEFVRQLASALDYAHTNDIAHRDVKPSNVLIRSKGGRESLILSDFGIAKALQDTSARHSTTAVGTTPYMAPEQIERPWEIDHRVDVYALGVVAYQMLAGELPFKPEEKGFIELVREIAEADPPPLVGHGVHPRIQRVVFKALEKHPDDRYASAGAFAQALDEAVRSWREETDEREAVMMLAGMGTRALEEKKWDDAAKYWRQYLILEPGSPLAENNLAIAEREIKLRQLRAEADRGEADGDWDAAIAALEGLLQIAPDDEVARERLTHAQTQREMSILYDRATGALEGGDLDQTIQLAQQISTRLPGYRDTDKLLDMALVRKVNDLKSEAFLAVGRGDAQQALDIVQQIRTADPECRFCPRETTDEIVQLANAKKIEALKDGALLAVSRGDAQQALQLVNQIRAADPGHQFCSQETLDEIVRSAEGLLDAADRSRKRRIYLGIALGVISVLVIGVVAIFLLYKLGGGLAMQEPSPSPTMTLLLTPTPRPTDTSTPPPPTETPLPTPSPTFPTVPTPIVEAIVGDGGAELRPGPTTWWFSRQTLAAGMEVELLGRDPAFPDWVYVGAADGSMDGWTQIENLNLNRDMDDLSLVTPVPTLTSTPGSDEPSTPPMSDECLGGPLTLDAWDVSKACTPGGWTATIFVAGHGGDCQYIYFWEGAAQGGPMSTSMTFEVKSAGYGTAIVGEASVTSAGQRVVSPLFVRPPQCD